MYSGDLKGVSPLCSSDRQRGRRWKCAGMVRTLCSEVQLLYLPGLFGQRGALFQRPKSQERAGGGVRHFDGSTAASCAIRFVESLDQSCCGAWLII